MSTAEEEIEDASTNYSACRARKRHHEETSTLLPLPFASLVSLATATSSLSIRLGGIIGKAALSAARYGTLTGCELGRVLLEGVLLRAGEDLGQFTSGTYGRKKAEIVLDKFLETLEYSLAHSSFFVSTVFQISSTTLTASLNASQFVLSGLDAIFGDTDTSRAVASIVGMIQRESKSNNAMLNGESLTIKDIFMGTIAFALLQRWSSSKTQEELQDYGIYETVWDIVVLNDRKDSQRSVYNVVTSTNEDHTLPSGDASVETALADDVTSLVSTMSLTRYPSVQTLGGPEEAFQQLLAQQLRPGTSIRIASKQLTTDVVTVEINGDPESTVEPPPGYSLVSIGKPRGPSDLSRKFVFQKQNKRRRRASFEVPEIQSRFQDLGTSPDEIEEPAGYARSQMDIIQAPADHPTNSKRNLSVEKSTEDSAAEPPVLANQSRHRTFPQEEAKEPENITGSAHDRAGKLENKPFRRNFKQTTSVKNLVDFWSKDRGLSTSKRHKVREINLQNDSENSHQRSSANTPRPRTAENPKHLRSSSSLQWGKGSNIGGKDQYSFEDFQPSPLNHHRISSSTPSIVTNASEKSLVLRGHLGHTEQEQLAGYLYREGSIPGIFPQDHFLRNLARFVKYSLASYGQNFLSLTGSGGNQPTLRRDDQHPSEHLSFSFYNGLPPSTVLLSTFVSHSSTSRSPEQGDNGLPLVHYVSLDHDLKAVVLTCRGTFGFEDVLTDMTCDYDDFLWLGRSYKVHRGILASARRLQSVAGGRIIATIKAALEEFDEYGLIICGHSLGGAVGAVLAMLLAQPNVSTVTGVSKYVTASNFGRTEFEAEGRHTLPAFRPIHAYTFGPAACISPSLQRDSLGLITTVVIAQDVVPYLSLGTLHDAQAVALKFKMDEDNAKTEVRKRVWEKVSKAFRNGTGFAALEGFPNVQPAEPALEDGWSWSALKSLRASMCSEKLVPPGEVFMVESEPVLRRYAFTESSTPKKRANDVTISTDRSYRAATHVRLVHIKDVEAHFAEMPFSTAMFKSHLPTRYEAVLCTLERGVHGSIES